MSQSQSQSQSQTTQELSLGPHFPAVAGEALGAAAALVGGLGPTARRHFAVQRLRVVEQAHLLLETDIYSC